MDDYGRDILSVQALLTKHVREGGREGGRKKKKIIVNTIK